MCANISILVDETSEDIVPIDEWEEEDEAEPEVCFLGVLFYLIIFHTHGFLIC